MASNELRIGSSAGFSAGPLLAPTQRVLLEASNYLKPEARRSAHAPMLQYLLRGGSAGPAAGGAAAGLGGAGAVGVVVTICGATARSA